MLFQFCARFLSGAFFCCLLVACASTPLTNQIKQSPPNDIAAQVELNKVPFFAQKAYQCGPAALATMLNYRHIKVSPDTLKAKVYIPKRHGSLQPEMIATARSYGLLAYPLTPKLTTLLQEINAGNPVLVMQNLAFAIWPQWHYAVVVGYDLNSQTLTLRSATSKRHQLSFATFERTWQRANHWAYVMLQPDQIPATAAPLTYLQTVNGLQTTDSSTDKLHAFQQAKQRWPDNHLVLMTLANAQYQAHQPAAAAETLQQALALDNNNAQTWNNFAYALFATGCHTAAIQAAQCALALAPSDDNIRHTVTELSHNPPLTASKCPKLACPLPATSP